MPNRKRQPGHTAALRSGPAPAPGPSALADQLHSAAIHLLRRVRREDARTGVGPAQLSALSVLVFAGPMTLKRLAAAEQVKPPTMSRTIAALERSGLARRRPDPGDRRSVLLRASARGTALLQRGRRRRIAVLAKPLRKTSPADRRLLARAADLMESLARSA